MQQHFRPSNRVPTRARKQAADLCGQLGVTKLVNSSVKAEGLSLQPFFSAKTHNEETPFRVIVSERGTCSVIWGSTYRDTSTSSELI
ncbi:hypothetical protein HPB48_015564 [Haemaphysalis longicornis]|uniref:Uncharacterized protein n=1 Tax=Haemaphysalis longicornis TaxID=44386 RepID=A0A9J6FHI7_HAELO|nr:hypothetical protein HPB48_015564 [Haemaphysalis longicornis]